MRQPTGFTKNQAAGAWIEAAPVFFVSDIDAWADMRSVSTGVGWEIVRDTGGTVEPTGLGDFLASNGWRRVSE